MTPKTTTGGHRGSGAPLHAPERQAPREPDHEVFLTRPELLSFLRLAADATDEAILDLPVCVLPNGETRWLKSQVLTWAAMGGTRPRHQRRGVRRVEL